ncbi:MAG: hypothetical protein AB7N54_13055 [Alphaproteobacteria bacterium]
MIGSPTLAPFVPAHLDALRPDAPDAAALAGLDRAAFCVRETGRAATALAADGRVLGIGGLASAADGVHAWILAGRELRARHPVALHRWARAALAALAAEGHRTVHATVARDFAAGHRWAARLGFVPCGGDGERFSTYRLTLAPGKAVPGRPG